MLIIYKKSIILITVKMVQKIKDLFEDYPKTMGFVVGIMCALLLVLIIFLVKGSEHSSGSIARDSPAAMVLLGPTEHQSDQNNAILLHGGASKPNLNGSSAGQMDVRFFGGGEHLEQGEQNDVTVGTPAPAAKPVKSNLTKGKSADEVADGDNDTKSTHHMLTRGGVARASVDSSRNRYLGLSSIGAGDYEGYVYKGHALSDEQGELTATGYGISESPWN